MLSYYYHNKNDLKVKEYLQKIKSDHKEENSILIYESTIIRQLIENIFIEENEINSEIKEGLKSLKEINFDSNYKELLEKLKN